MVKVVILLGQVCVYSVTYFLASMNGEVCSSFVPLMGYFQSLATRHHHHGGVTFLSGRVQSFSLRTTIQVASCGCLPTRSRLPWAVFSTALGRDTRSPVQARCSTCISQRRWPGQSGKVMPVDTDRAKINASAASAAGRPSPNPFRS